MTFQACSITEARHLYDQLAVLTPVIVSANIYYYACPDQRIIFFLSFHAAILTNDTQFKFAAEQASSNIEVIMDRQ